MHSLVLSLIFRRLKEVLLLIICMVLITNLLLEATPGSYCSITLPDHASYVQRQTCQQQHEPPFGQRSIRSLELLAHFNLGRSLETKQPIISELAFHAPSTFKLAFISFSISLFIGIIAGIIQTQYRHKLLTSLLNWAGILVISMPPFILAIFFLQLFTRELHWLPVFSDPDNWKGLILPTFAIVIPTSAFFMRVTKNALMGVMNRDYIRTARAKGLKEFGIIAKHAFRNASAAIIPIAGLVLIGLLDGVLVVETLFTRPGLGRYSYEALMKRDYPALQGVVLLVGILTITVNLFTDLLQAWLLPSSREDILKR